ncbi:hypothetical protein RvY_00123-2 [Ramazzottius varieornatus]|uniref:Uncharacterized protein n=1 Tax=Ramazzottius varieornatus TaxID=947166 RepID=A0A1D1UCM3_RAMVA|nr:hypothetical protein RvY_00123-2 [Ramazzottius varieornatus]
MVTSASSVRVFLAVFPTSISNLSPDSWKKLLFSCAANSEHSLACCGIWRKKIAVYDSIPDHCLLLLIRLIQLMKQAGVFGYILLRWSTSQNESRCSSLCP